MRVLVHIPARAGSKGVPRKNLRTVGGLSLVARAVLVGRRFLRTTGVRGDVFVDTDGTDIQAEAKRAGALAPFLRSDRLASDAASTVDTVVEALDRLERLGREYDVVVLLQPTSPLRTTEDIERCFEAHRATGSAVTVVALAHPPQRALELDPDGALQPLFSRESFDAPRQAHQQSVEPNGAVCVVDVPLLREKKRFLLPGRTRCVSMPAERSIDVDTELDLSLAEALLAARPSAVFELGGRTLGRSNGCLVIAEAGVNHNGDVRLAHELVDAAADAGADAVKFQTFDPKKLVSEHAAMAAYQELNTGKRESQSAMLERLVLPRAAHEGLQAHAAKRGLLFLSTPFDEGSADFLDALGVPAFKVPSGELTNHPFLAHLARKGRPLLLSSGMATQMEVAQALEVIEQYGGPPVALFHCVTSYPAAPQDTNLKAMDALRVCFGRPTGLSDHTLGITVMLAAAARGAHLVEKHFTLSRAMDGPDHAASLEPGELKAMVRGIRDIEAALGDGIKAPRPAELPLIAVGRKSLHAARTLPAGHRLERRDVIALRPGTGLSPARLEDVLGQPLLRSLEEGQILTEEHFDSEAG